MRSDGKLSQDRNHGIARGDIHGELSSGLRDARISPGVDRGLKLTSGCSQGDGPCFASRVGFVTQMWVPPAPRCRRACKAGLSMAICWVRPASFRKPANNSLVGAP